MVFCSGGHGAHAHWACLPPCRPCLGHRLSHPQRPEPGLAAGNEAQGAVEGQAHPSVPSAARRGPLGQSPRRRPPACLVRRASGEKPQALAWRPGRCGGRAQGRSRSAWHWGWGGTCLLRSSRSCLRPLSAPLCRGSYWGPAWGQDWVLRHLPPWASHLGMHRGSVDTAPGVAGAKPGGPHTSCFRAGCDPLGYR